MIPITCYLRDEQLPPDLNEARKIKKQATRSTLLNDMLNKRGFSLPYLRCVKQDEAKYILQKVQKAFVEIIQG